MNLYQKQCTKCTYGTIEMINAAEALKKVSLRKIVMDSLRELGAPVLGVEIRRSEGVGLYALVTLDCGARRALEYWLKVVDSIREYGIPIFIAWTGSTDVTPEELGVYMGRILAKMDVFLAAEKPVDVVGIIKEEWGL